MLKYCEMEADNNLWAIVIVKTAISQMPGL